VNLKRARVGVIDSVVRFVDAAVRLEDAWVRLRGTSARGAR
jgi:hypothetical protein